MKNINTTLLLIIKGNRILLAMKKRGFGVGLYNGVGGKMQDGETIYETMIRETKEEINVEPIDAKLVGMIDFDLYLKGEKAIEKVHIFVANNYKGEVRESEEMKPKWFDINKIPYEKMFDDDLLWLPDVINGKLVKGNVVFDKNNHTVESKISVVKKLEI